METRMLSRGKRAFSELLKRQLYCFLRIGLLFGAIEVKIYVRNMQMKYERE